MTSFDALWDELAPVGRDPRTGGYRRFAYTPAELACREWFVGAATARGMNVETDRNGNLWAWDGDPDAEPGLVLGSHLDSVPDGGAYDGPLGIVSAFAVLDLLRAGGGRARRRPLGIAAFADEEGARFGVACAGSRLLTGALDPDRARGLVDADGVGYADAVRAAGVDPAGLGRDAEALRRIAAFVELHVEQGRGLVDEGAAVGVGAGIWPHGRWRFAFAGRADHAGTTRMADRRDPMLAYAVTALAANKQARLKGARATFGRVEVEPGGTNAIPSAVCGWLDARAPDQRTLDGMVTVLTRLAQERAERDRTAVTVTAESVSPAVDFDRPLRDRLSGLLGGVPVLATGAGHDAGVLATAGVRSGMLFVRNPTGVSHAPDEHAERDDCLAGVDALVAVVTELGDEGGPR